MHKENQTICRDHAIFYLYKTLGKIQFLHLFVFHFYKTILLRIVIFYLKSRHNNIQTIQPRHSITEIDNFNAFLSDIDLSIVLIDGTSEVKVIQSYLKLKKILIMLDFPQVYFDSEYCQLRDIQSGAHWNTVNTAWYIRKINWNLISISTNSSELNRIKKLRSNQICYSKILINPDTSRKTFRLNDFIWFKRLTSEEEVNSTPTLCYFSHYLETTTKESIQILLTQNEFSLFNSLMPTELTHHNELELKNAIQDFEFLITKSSIRIDQSFNRNIDEKIKWINKLDRI